LGLNQRLEQYNAKSEELNNYTYKTDYIINQIEMYRIEILEWKAKQNEYSSIVADIAQILKQAKVNFSKSFINEGIKEIFSAEKKHEQWKKSKVAYEIAICYNQSLLESQKDFEVTIKELDAKIDVIQGKQKSWSLLKADQNSQIYAATIQKLDTDWKQAQESRTLIQETIKSTNANLKHPAEIDEEMHYIRDQINQLISFQDALILAKNELENATSEFQKQFAPRLEQIMSDGLENITDARYSRVQVDPNNLSIDLVAPERNTMVNTEQLSTGTRELIYFILRIGVARLMSKSNEKLPLLLDDPFVQLDTHRQRQTLEFLKMMSEETQILLFTKDEFT
jgi:uncharacterized protein YhaN